MVLTVPTTTLHLPQSQYNPPELKLHGLHGHETKYCYVQTTNPYGVTELFAIKGNIQQHDNFFGNICIK
jgi:hypothetical protein